MDSMNDKANVSTAAAPSLNAVHIMSIHKSKGLEFPIVFIGGLFDSFNAQSHRDQVLLDPLLGMGLKLRNKKLSKTLLHRAILARDDEKKLAEEMRILYVAMTRARENLYMVGCPPNKTFDIGKYAVPLSDYQIMNAKNQMKWIMGAFFPGPLPEGSENIKLSRSIGDDKIFLTIQSCPSFSVSDNRMSKEQFAAWRESAIRCDSEKALSSLRFEYPYAESTLATSKKSVTDLIDTVFEYSPAVPAFMEKIHVPTNAEKGIAVHRVLELLPLKEMDENELSEQISLFIREKKLSCEIPLPELVSSSASFVHSPLYERLINSERVERELEFSILLSGADIEKAFKHKDNSVENVEISAFSHKLNAGSLLQGVIDCCFLENGEWVIIDYKTTALRNFTPYEAASQYEMQLDMYALALEKLTGCKVKEKWVFLISAGMAVLL